jgi:hypothetical protein
MFRTIVVQVLSRMPDYRIVEGGAERYQSIALVNGYVRVRAEFTPGSRIPTSVRLDR